MQFLQKTRSAVPKQSTRLLRQLLAHFAISLADNLSDRFGLHVAGRSFSGDSFSLSERKKEGKKCQRPKQSLCTSVSDGPRKKNCIREKQICWKRAKRSERREEEEKSKCEPSSHQGEEHLQFSSLLVGEQNNLSSPGYSSRSSRPCCC